MDTPSAGPAAPPTPPTPPPLVLNRLQSCLKCGYQLQGLPLGGVCPECGTPVQDSLKGYFLQYADPEYRRKVGLGLSLILNAILLMIILMILGFALNAAFGQVRGVQLTFACMALGMTGMTIAGYWLYTEPDQSYTGVEKPNSARQIARIAVLAQAGIQAIDIVLTLAGVDGTPGWGVPRLLLTLLGLGAWATQYFAIMHYTRWMGSRIPDALIQRRAKTYLWLLPALATVGVLLVGLGPLIALIAYWNLLDRLRKHVRSINATGQPARLEEMAV